MDVWYVDNWSLRLDAYIFAKAVVLLSRRQGVYGPAAIATHPKEETEPKGTNQHFTAETQSTQRSEHL
jgi:hypothetical protein